MIDRGWEYIPTLPPDVILQRAAVEAAADGRDAPDPTEVSLPPNPNTEIVAGLDDVANEERATAYWGNLESGGDDPGCYMLTYEGVWGVDILDPALDAKTLEIEARIASDPRVGTALERYVTCMAADGYRVTSTDDVTMDHILWGEEWADRVAKDGDTPELQSERAAHDAEYDEAYAIHESCIEPYYEVEHEVHAEISPG